MLTGLYLFLKTCFCLGRLLLARLTSARRNVSSCLQRADFKLPTLFFASWTSFSMFLWSPTTSCSDFAITISHLSAPLLPHVSIGYYPLSVCTMGVFDRFSGDGFAIPCLIDFQVCWNTRVCLGPLVSSAYWL